MQKRAPFQSNGALFFYLTLILSGIQNHYFELMMRYRSNINLSLSQGLFLLRRKGTLFHLGIMYLYQTSIK